MPTRRSAVYLILLALLLVGATGCDAPTHAAGDDAGVALAEDSPATQALPTLTPLPSWTPSPTATREPSATPSPTATATATAIPSPTLTPTPDPNAEVTYVVQSGDTMGQIAQQFGLPLESLVVYNDLDDGSRIQEGSLLRIPVGEARVAGMYATATVVAYVTPTAVPAALPERVVLPMAQVYQARNNCAPSTTAMMLSAYGITASQQEMAALQKPNANDVNVTAEEVVASLNETGLQAYLGYNGTIDLVQRLLAAGFPVMTEEWMAYDGGVGHFRAIRGYDRREGAILYNDSFYGPNLWRGESQFLRDWHPYNGKFIVPYRAEQAATLAAILGPDWYPATMYQSLATKSAAQVQANPNDAYAWWGWGEALLWQGKPEEAINAFEQSIATGILPARYEWYRYGYLDALNRVGRYEDVLARTEMLLGQMQYSEDIRYHRAVALMRLGRTEEAMTQLERALADNPRFTPARLLLQQLGG